VETVLGALIMQKKKKKHFEYVMWLSCAGTVIRFHVTSIFNFGMSILRALNIYFPCHPFIAFASDEQRITGKGLIVWRNLSSWWTSSLGYFLIGFLASSTPITPSLRPPDRTCRQYSDLKLEAYLTSLRNHQIETILTHFLNSNWILEGRLTTSRHITTIQTDHPSLISVIHLRSRGALSVTKMRWDLQQIWLDIWSEL